MTEPVFYDGLAPLLRTLIIGVTGYVGILVMLRATGKRTLSKFNMFDFIITVAFGSVLATMLLSKEVVLAQGLMAIAVLVLLQLAVTYFSTRFSAVEDVIKAEPRLLYRNGQIIEKALKDERVSRTELISAARENGYGSLDQIGAMILETDGTITAIGVDKLGPAAVLKDVKGA
ncbi:DUF421 domain-containing protein [Parvularcula sp. LCG005]|uniref:DUF421 domain-containing protein n=1 Tax=Parvularcula sp. LCG005 TaxID=3078805 RepID=UPI002943D5BD|nr:YetF domain-containing protein [Parvularcula sp. LCG005]WOI52494.1 DUF421 domain-containing protein [Parvularcula sp. LCG005]